MLSSKQERLYKRESPCDHESHYDTTHRTNTQDCTKTKLLTNTKLVMNTKHRRNTRTVRTTRRPTNTKFGVNTKHHKNIKFDMITKDRTNTEDLRTRNSAWTQSIVPLRKTVRTRRNYEQEIRPEHKASYHYARPYEHGGTMNMKDRICIGAASSTSLPLFHCQVWQTTLTFTEKLLLTASKGLSFGQLWPL